MNTLRFTHIATLDVGDNFYIDIELDNKEHIYDAWIWEANTGIKAYMYGQHTEMEVFGERYILSLEEIVANAMGNARQHKKYYIRDYMEGDK